LKCSLTAYLSSNVSDGLLFDSKMGGLVSNNGLHDKGEDFGNGRYNGKPSSFLSNIGLHVFTTNNITFLICFCWFVSHTNRPPFSLWVGEKSRMTGIVWAAFFQPFFSSLC
jgi:endoglucanase Acf2